MMTNHKPTLSELTEQVIKEWQHMYDEWEEGRLPSPSPHDLVLTFDRLIPMNRSEADLDDLADEIAAMSSDGAEPEELTAHLCGAIILP